MLSSFITINSEICPSPPPHPFFFSFLWIHVHDNLSIWYSWICSFQANYETQITWMVWAVYWYILNSLSAKQEEFRRGKWLKNIVNYFAISQIADCIVSSYEFGAWSWRYEYLRKLKFNMIDSSSTGTQV